MRAGRTSASCWLHSSRPSRRGTRRPFACSPIIMAHGTATSTRCSTLPRFDSHLETVSPPDHIGAKSAFLPVTLHGRDVVRPPKADVSAADFSFSAADFFVPEKPLFKPVHGGAEALQADGYADTGLGRVEDDEHGVGALFQLGDHLVLKLHFG